MRWALVRWLDGCGDELEGWKAGQTASGGEGFGVDVWAVALRLAVDSRVEKRVDRMVRRGGVGEREGGPLRSWPPNSRMVLSSSTWAPVSG